MFRNWKTSLAGLVVGTTMFLNALPQEGKPIEKNNVFAALGITLLGLFGKDHDKSGTI